jgi:uncharacterized membrane protein
MISVYKKASMTSLKTQILALLAVAIFDVSVTFSSTLVARLIIMVFLFFVPGLALMGKLRGISINFWQKAGLALSLSLFYLMSIGLIIDVVLPIIFHINHPLALRYLLVAINVSFLSILVLTRRQPWQIRKPPSLMFSEKTWITATLGSALAFFLIGSVCGALILNDGGSNLVAICAQSSLLCLLLFIFVFHKNLRTESYPYIVLTIALGLLYSFSLRGGAHILGWDINQEYHTYLTTALNNHWIVGGMNHSPYNACLSLTILPTIIHNLTNISGELIFKIIYPFFFSFVPVLILLIAQKFLKPFYGFLAALLLMSKLEFANEFPALDRQEVAFLFITILVLVILSEQIQIRYKRILFFCLLVGSTFAHYSTTYTFLMIIALAYLLEKLFEVFLHHPKDKIRLRGKSVISGGMVLFAFLTVFLWNIQVTQSGQNIGSTIFNSISTLNHNSFFGVTSHSEEASNALGLSTPEPSQYELNQYVRSVTTSSQLSSQKTYADAGTYPVTFLPSETTSPPQLPQLLIEFQSKIIAFSQIALRLALFVGLMSLLYRYRRVREDEPKRLLTTLSLAAVGITFFFAVIPGLSVAYGFGRLFDEALVVLAVPIIAGLVWLTQKFGKLQTLAVCVVSFVYFSSFFGLTAQVFGGSPSLMLNNSGSKYNFYIHDGEVASIRWLDAQDTQRQPIYADIYAYLKFESMSPIHMNLNLLNTNVLPTTITKNSYVYVSQTNLNGRWAVDDPSFFNQSSVGYTFPSEFLDSNKNKVFANQDSEIYR